MEAFLLNRSQSQRFNNPFCQYAGDFEVCLGRRSFRPTIVIFGFHNLSISH